MKSKLFLCFAVVLGGMLVGCVMISRCAKRDSEPENVKFSASLPKENAANQPIYLHLRIENDRSGDIAVDWWGHATSITIENARGGKVPRTTRGTDVFMSPESRTTAELAAGMPQPHGILHARHSDGTTIDLSPYFQLNSGTYYLSVSTVVWPRESQSHVLKLQAGPIPFTIGSVP